jgi:hypothetical protein
MLEICIQTSFDQNVQLILKSYLSGTLPWLGTDTSIKSGTVKLFFQTKILAK